MSDDASKPSHPYRDGKGVLPDLESAVAKGADTERALGVIADLRELITDGGFDHASREDLSAYAREVDRLRHALMLRAPDVNIALAIIAFSIGVGAALFSKAPTPWDWTLFTLFAVPALERLWALNDARAVAPVVVELCDLAREFPALARRAGPGQHLAMDS